MKKLLKWIGGLVVLLVVVGIGLVIAANLLFDRKRDRVVKLEVKGVTIGSDEATLARGKYLFASRGCGDCHAMNGAGRVFIDDPAGGLKARAPNIIEAPATEMTHKLTAIKLLLDRALPVIDLDKVLDQKMARELAERLADVRQMAEAHRIKCLELDRAQQKIAELEMIANVGRGEPDGLGVLN